MLRITTRSRKGGKKKSRPKERREPGEMSRGNRISPRMRLKELLASALEAEGGSSKTKSWRSKGRSTSRMTAM
jgi:hypothetical protein